MGLLHGPGPDDDVFETNQAISLNDLGELGSRLTGGLGSTNRGGRVVFQSDMSAGLAEFPSQAKIGTGAKIAVDAAVAEFGGQSIRLTHGKAIGNQTTIGRTLPGGYSTKIGYEVGVLNQADSIRFNMVMISQVATGFTQYAIQVTTNTTNTNVNFYHSSGAYVPFETGLAPVIPGGFHSFKAIFDTKNGWYDALLINGIRYPMGDAFVPFTGILPEAVHQSFYFTFTVEAREALNKYLNVGSFVLTIDEP